MSIALSTHQLQSAAKTAIRVVDPETHEEYVVVNASWFDRLKEASEEIDALRETYPAADRTFAEGWNDPKMDDYDRYEELKP